MNDTYENKTPGTQETEVETNVNQESQTTATPDKTKGVAPKGASRAANGPKWRERELIEDRYAVIDEILPVTVEGIKKIDEIGSCYLSFYRNYIFQHIANVYRIKQSSLPMLAQSVANICFYLDAMSNIDYVNRVFFTEEAQYWSVPAEFAQFVLPVKLVMPVANVRAAHDYRQRLSNVELAKLAGVEYYPSREDARAVFEGAVDQFYSAFGRQSWQRRPLSELIMAQVIDASTAAALSDDGSIHEECRPIPSAICAYDAKWRTIDARHAMWNLIDEVILTIKNNKG